MKNVQLDHAGHRPAAQRLPICFLVHDIELASNVGALFRIADALGVERLHLTGSTPKPPDRRVRKAARSADAHVPHDTASDALATAARLKAEGWRIVSLELTTRSIDIRTLPVVAGDRICLVLGSESAGVCQALLDLSDATVHIPMLGHNSSMNVGSACAIATFEIARRFLDSAVRARP